MRHGRREWGEVPDWRDWFGRETNPLRAVLIALAIWFVWWLW